MRGKGEIIAVILVPIILMSILLLPVISPETIISGTVRDDEGDPLPGATVYSPGSIFTSSSVTDQEGKFSLALKGYGDRTLRAEKDGYWIHKRICGIEEPGVPVAGFDFQLAKNQEVLVTDACVFCTRKSNQTSAFLGIALISSSQEIVIHDLAGTGVDLEYQFGGGRYLRSNAPSLFDQLLVEISGEYWDTPGVDDNCYAIEVLSSFSGYAGPDYLDKSEVEGEIRHLLPGGSIYTNNTLGSQAVIPFQLSPSISVNILGEVFTHTFVVELRNPIQNGIMVDCELNNNDIISHDYKIFTDETGFLHIWQVS